MFSFGFGLAVSFQPGKPLWFNFNGPTVGNE